MHTGKEFFIYSDLQSEGIMFLADWHHDLMFTLKVTLADE